MGMSATQARFLSLTARKSNVEFEGQQINQQRLSLSNESANYYSQLCNMSVPTPPCIDDFTKVSYTFNDGAMTNTITSMIARENGVYSVSYLKQWQDDYSIVAASSNLVEKNGDNYSIGSSKLRKLGNSSPDICNDDEIAKFEYLDKNLNEVFKREDGKYYYKDSDGNEKEANNSSEEDLIIYIMGENGALESLITKDKNGNYYKNSVSTDEYLNTLDPKQIQQVLETEKYYANLLNLSSVNSNSAAKGSDGWMVRYVKDSLTGAYKPYFYPISELKKEDAYTNNLCNVSCFSLGSSTQTEEVINKIARVEKDSSGRYVSIIIYNNQSDCDKNVNGETFTLTTSTVKDEEAFNDAMNKFQYEQAQYDKAVQDINSKLEIVQQQDKKLELKLKQLDTEENAISNEMEAVKKVVSKNVETTFKTFSA